MASLHAMGALPPISESYIREALFTYGAGRFKATAVIAGAAAESIVLDLRDCLKSRIHTLGTRTVPRDLDDWRIKRVLDALQKLVTAEKAFMPKALFEAFEAYWPAFTQQIRVARNEAGHPSSIDPVGEDAVLESLLIFPELLKLSAQRETWITTDYK